jgi:hypothetical protein
LGNLIRIAFISLFLFLFQDLLAQTNVYKGNSRFPTDVVCNILEGEFRSARNSYGYPALFTIRGQQIFKGESISLLDVMFTYRDGYLFLGYSENPYDIAYNYDGEHIYFRNRDYAMDIAFTIFRDGIYAGPTTFVSDVLYTIDGPYTETELFLILYALDLL